MGAYPVVDVPATAVRQDETLGTKPKFWFRAADDELWLFKRGRANEDWSEKVAAEVAALVGVPHATVELSQCDGQPGTVSRSFLVQGDEMYHGNELLLARDPAYPLRATYRVRQHTVEAVFETLAWHATGVPADLVAPWADFDGCDLMVGFLALDALVANTDRHHENWAVVRRGRRAFLAPSYDHAASLGRNETDRRMQVRLEGTDPRVTVHSYVAKGRSALYPEGPASRAWTPLQAFRRAVAIRPSAARHWRDRIEGTSPVALETAVARVPGGRISDRSRRFAQAILLCNRERLVLGEEDDER